MKINGTDLAMIKGDTEYLTISLHDQDGPVPLVHGDIIDFTVKYKIKSADPILEKRITVFDEHGNATIKIEPEDTLKLRTASCVYDIQLTTVNEDVTTIVGPSKFIIMDGVTDNMWEDLVGDEEEGDDID